MQVRSFETQLGVDSARCILPRCNDTNIVTDVYIAVGSKLRDLRLLHSCMMQKNISAFVLKIYSDIILNLVFCFLAFNENNRNIPSVTFYFISCYEYRHCEWIFRILRKLLQY
jgi:hypothetical protein